MEKNKVILVLAIVMLSSIATAGCITQKTTITPTPNITWSVSAESWGTSTQINEEDRRISVSCDVNSTSHVMLFKDTNTTFWMPPIEFIIQADQQGVADITKGYTTQCHVVNPDIGVYYGGADYDLVRKNDQNKHSFNWSYSRTEYEKTTITVTSAYGADVDLDIDWNAYAVSLMPAGSTKTISLDVAGELWTLTLIVNDVNV